jgi:hypothetical protein
MLERIVIRVMALVLLLAGCAAPLSQVPPSGMPAAVPAPDIRVGDVWTYHVRDGFTGTARGEQRHEVVEVSGDYVRVAGILERGDGTQLYDRAWNWLRRPATNLQTFEYAPAYQAFAFPLAAGKRWHQRLVATDPADGRRFPVWIDGAVVGWERVKVPAGEFDALKVERTVYFEYWEYAVRGRSRIRETEWYAPAAKQAVRKEARSQYWRLIAADDRPGFVQVRNGRAGRAGGGRGLLGGRDDGGPRYVEDDWLIYELASYSVR